MWWKDVAVEQLEINKMATAEKKRVIFHLILFPDSVVNNYMLPVS